MSPLPTGPAAAGAASRPQGHGTSPRRPRISERGSVSGAGEAGQAPGAAEAQCRHTAAPVFPSGRAGDGCRGKAWGQRSPSPEHTGVLPRCLTSPFRGCLSKPPRPRSSRAPDQRGPERAHAPTRPPGGTSALNVPPLRTNPVWPVPRSTLEHHASSRLRELATPKVRNNIWCTHMSEVGAPLARIPGPPAASGWRPCRGAGSRPQSGGRGAGPALPTATARHGDARSPPGRRHRVWLQPRHLVL